MRITTFSRISSLVLASLSFLMTYTLYMSHLQLNQLDKQNAIFSQMKSAITLQLTQSVTRYLATGDAIELQSAANITTKLETSVSQLAVAIDSTNLINELNHFSALITGPLRSSGKLANDPFQLITFNEKDLTDTITALKSLLIAKNIQLQQSDLLLISDVQTSLSSLTAQRQRYFNQLDNAQWTNLINTVAETQLRITKLQGLIKYQTHSEINDEIDNFLLEDEVEDVATIEDFTDELLSLINRYPKELKNTQTVLQQLNKNQKQVTSKTSQLQAAIISLEKPIVLYAKNQRAQTYVQLAVLAFSLILFSLLLFYTQKYWIVKPLYILDSALSSLVKSNTRQRLSFANKNNEIGVIALHFNQLIDNVALEQQNKVEQIDQVTTSLDLLQEDFHSISRYSDSSTQAIADITASLTSIHQLAEQVDEQTQTVHGITSNTNQQMHHAAKQISQLSQATQATHQAGDNSLSAIQSLNCDMQSVGSIVSAIHQIADQTNLLALNAAIEAARAGEKGRGFAVVADEVRSLSQKTQQALEQINTFLAQLHQSSSSLEQEIESISARCQQQLNSANEVTIQIQDVIAQSETAQFNAANTNEGTRQQVKLITGINQQVLELQSHSNESQTKTNFAKQQISTQVSKILTIFA